jgi:hypothetical protein
MVTLVIRLVPGDQVADAAKIESGGEIPAIVIEGKDNGMTDVFHRILFRVRHPNIDPSAITAALGMAPQRSWKVGDQRTAANGRLLKGNYDHTYWSYREEHPASKDFLQKVGLLAERLKLHASFLRQLTASGGSCEIYVQLSGLINDGDSLAPSALRLLSELDITLSIEVFPN